MDRRIFMGASIGAGSMAALAAQRVPGANDRIRVGLIGCGGRMGALLKEFYPVAAAENVEVVAICDIWRQQREWAVATVKEFGGKEPQAVVGFEDLLAMKDVDAVIIATPDHLHAPMLIAAVNAGKDVYVEKPIAFDMRELNGAVDAVKRSGRVVQCGTQTRSYTSSAAARAFIQGGGLGKIFKIEQSRNAYKPYWHRKGEREAKPEDVDWKGFLLNRKARPFNPEQFTGWYGYREFSYGPHTNLMVHYIDLIHFITGAKYPIRAVAMGGIYRWKDPYDAPDSVEVAFDYPEDGFMVRYATVFGTRANTFLKFIGTRGVMDATVWREPWLLDGSGSEEPDRIRAGAKIPEADCPTHMHNWLQCLRSRRKPNADIDAGYGQTVACVMADEAMTRGRRMVHDPVKRTVSEG